MPEHHTSSITHTGAFPAGVSTNLLACSTIHLTLDALTINKNIGTQTNPEAGPIMAWVCSSDTYDAANQTPNSNYPYCANDGCTPAAPENTPQCSLGTFQTLVPKADGTLWEAWDTANTNGVVFVAHMDGQTYPTSASLKKDMNGRCIF
jgi:hypothetical protein